jgi:3-oxoadipate enol-lactonase
MPFAHTNGCELYYEVTDFTRPWEGEAEAVLFLHGLHGSLAWWNWFQTAVFARHYRVLTVDLRGHGKSHKPAGGYSIQNMAEDVYGVLDRLGIARTHICGASMGGMIALQLALAHPDCASCLVLVDSFARAPAGLMGALDQWIADTEKRGYAGVMSTFDADYGEILFSADFRRRHPGFPAYETKMVLDNLMPDAAFIGACRAIQAFDVSAELAQIDVPALIIVPNEGLAVAEAQRLAEALPHAAVWAPEGVGHSVHVEAPDDFNAQVMGFLSDAGKRQD